ncbi:MAG TPA: undecaprenyl-diphosphate phosphatase, partial [Miltoncostaeaceae bacterium]|nr:undecaprenyl-diphosphate phosphatase [Miltoncostaeaceae bacterium]
MLASLAALVVVIAWSVTEAGDVVLSIPEAILLGVVEGLTEFLPVSSTGHLTVTQDLLGLTDTEEAKAAADSYAIAIQAGAIVAVLGIYRRRISNTVLSVVGRGSDQEAGRRMAVALTVGFIPAGLTAFLLGDLIKEHLFGIWPVVAAWFVGGVVILLWPRPDPLRGRALELITARDALIIGFAQIIALWPGVSRSLIVILACLAIGLSLAASVEFAFLLGLVTLGIATLYETFDQGSVIV